MNKLVLILVILTFSSMVHAVITVDNGIKDEEQKYYKNSSNEGMNQRERLDSTVKEINNLHAEIAGLKADVAELKKEIEKIKKSK